MDFLQDFILFLIAIVLAFGFLELSDAIRHPQSKEKLPTNIFGQNEPAQIIKRIDPLEDIFKK